MSGSEADIHLFNETSLSLPIGNEDLARIASLIAQKESVSFSFIEFVVVDEAKIIEVNKEYLNKDYITDTISFHYDEGKRENIEGTVFICAPRINEQASEFNQDRRDEFLRVSIHSLLHLTGYDDTEESDKAMMTRKEDRYLSLFKE